RRRLEPGRRPPHARPRARRGAAPPGRAGDRGGGGRDHPAARLRLPARARCRGDLRPRHADPPGRARGARRPARAARMSAAAPAESPEALCEAVRRGDRRALARTITLLESTRADLAARGQAVLEGLVAETGGATRVGITGPPGVGKSTFIEALGLHLVARDHRVAGLAVDPSSPVTGGSILGDKTRMERLAREDAAFIRPSPSG